MSQTDYFDLGAYRRAVTTSSPEAQTWFDRGLNWLFGFNHGEAIKCFRRALEHDPGCAMAHWGVSYASGPNYNLPWYLYDPHGRQMALEASFDAMQGALANVEGTTPVEQALIQALPARYPQREAIEDMAPWDQAYTREMRKVFESFRNDLDVRSIFAEAIMNETPWKMWDLTTGKAAEGAGTDEAVAVLEQAFADIPAAWDHPGPAAPLCAPDGDVALPAAGAARRRPAARDHAGFGPPHSHADASRRAVRQLSRRAGLQPEGARAGPAVSGLFG